MKGLRGKSRTTSVLLVDDQPEVRRVLRRLLERSGHYAVAEAGSGSDALELVHEQPPDAVILDLSMPHMSGLSVIPQVHARSPRTRVLVLSSHHGMEQEILALGASAFLPKTSPPKKVLATLAAVLER